MTSPSDSSEASMPKESDSSAQQQTSATPPGAVPAPPHNPDAQQVPPPEPPAPAPTAPPAPLSAAATVPAPAPAPQTHETSAQNPPSVIPQVLRALTPAHWKTAGLYGALALAGAFAASLLTVMLLLTGLTAGSSDIDGPENLGGAWFAAIIQFMSMGFLSPLTGTAQVEAGFGLVAVDVNMSAFFVPVIVPVAAICAVALYGRRVTGGMTLPHGPTRAVIASTAGLGFAVALALLTALIPIKFGSPDEGEFTLRALTVWGMLLSALVIFAVSYRTLGHSKQSGSSSPTTGSVIARIWGQGIRVAVAHLGGVALLLGVIAFVVVVSQADDARSMVIAGFPLLLPILAANAVAIGSMSTVMFTGDIAITADNGAVNDTLTMFSSELPVWVRILLPIVAVAALLIAGLRWRSTAGFTTARNSQWAILPAVYGGVGLVLLAIGTMHFAIRAPMVGQDTTGIAPAPWTFLVLAIIGVAVEASARYVAPQLLRVLPPGLVSVLTFRVNNPHATVVTAPAAAGVAGTAGTTGLGAQEQPAPVGAEPADAAGSPDSASGSPAQANPASHSTGSPDGDPLPTAKPLSPQAKKAWAIAGISVVALTVLLIAGNATRNYLANNQFGPQQKVEEYLTALVDGRASDALSLLDVNVTSTDRVMLADDVYAAAENRPTEFRIDDVEYGEEAVQVTAQVKQEGKNYPIIFTLVADGRQSMFFDDWRITSGMEQNLFVFQATDTLNVNGLDLSVPRMHSADEPLPQGASAETMAQYAMEEAEGYLPVLPGTYTFKAPAGTKYVSYGPDVTVTITPGERQSDDTGFGWGEEGPKTPTVAFQRGYTQAVVDDALAQVEPLLDACLTRNVIVPEGCEIASWENKYWDAMTDIERTWGEEPQLLVANELNGMWEYEQPDPSTVTGDLSVFLVEGRIDLVYSARNEGDDDWNEGRTHNIRPFVESGGSLFSDPLALPITIDGDTLTVDTSKLNKQHDSWVK
ncbi:hypothetical protein [Jonesia quinghaiensis]|uniref:hypothetical protein n=1 Tax=Jonesia quinghaiensis TaxID=262806 RepID=UPI0004207F57|nr:hypothetical protein [Jonesia quinghaiensis]